MMDVAIGQVWEVYSPKQRQWPRVVVAEVQDEEVTLRYEGSLELLRVTLDDMKDDERFRIAAE